MKKRSFTLLMSALTISATLIGTSPVLAETDTDTATEETSDKEKTDTKDADAEDADSKDTDWVSGFTPLCVRRNAGTAKSRYSVYQSDFLSGSFFRLQLRQITAYPEENHIFQSDFRFPFLQQNPVQFLKTASE